MHNTEPAPAEAGRAAVASTGATGEKKVEYGTLRTFLEDSRDISKLVKLRGRGENAADVYRELCAPVIRAAVRELLQKQLEEHDLGEAGA